LYAAKEKITSELPMTIKFQLFLYLHLLGRRRRHIAAALGRNIQNIMNWIILIVAGLCEVGFTYCLGRAKSLTLIASIVGLKTLS
jgi:hypothetical protein